MTNASAKAVKSTVSSVLFCRLFKKLSLIGLHPFWRVSFCCLFFDCQLAQARLIDPCSMAADPLVWRDSSNRRTATLFWGAEKMPLRRGIELGADGIVEAGMCQHSVLFLRSPS